MSKVCSVVMNSEGARVRVGSNPRGDYLLLFQFFELKLLSVDWLSINEAIFFQFTFIRL